MIRAQNKENLNDLIKTKELAKYLGVHEEVVRRSRYTGYLLGVKTPKYLKIGRTVRYKKEAVLKWLDDLEDIK